MGTKKGLGAGCFLPKQKLAIAALAVAFAAMLLSGCSQITKESAEQKAVDFMNKNVKFFAKEGESKQNVTSFNIDSVQSFKDGNSWLVVIQVSSYVMNETKKRSVPLKIDSSGRVTEFSGMPVPE